MEGLNVMIWGGLLVSSLLVVSSSASAGLDEAHSPCCVPLSYNAGPSPSRRQPQVEQDLRAAVMPEPDVILKVIPETPTTYERTMLVITTDTPNKVLFEIPELLDETRGIRARMVAGHPSSLEKLFGPKNGLTDHITVLATIRLSYPRGEKIIRKTILLRNVSPEVWLKAETQGVIHVTVLLDVPTKPEQHLSGEEIQAIAAAQDELLAALAGTEHKIIRRFKFIPGLLLKVGPEALAVLERFPRVVKVTEELLARPF